MEFTFDYFGKQYQIPDISPERLDFIAKVFETVCEIHTIPLNARDEREALALSIILYSRSIADGGRLLEVARKASERYRRTKKNQLSSWFKIQRVNEKVNVGAPPGNHPRRDH